MTEFYNKHYIRIDVDNNITHGFSDAFEQPQSSDTLVNARGGKHFGLMPDNTTPYHTENIRNMTIGNIPLFKWDESQATESEPWRGVVKRTPEEIEADRIAIEQSPASQIARLNAQISAGLVNIVVQLYDNQCSKMSAPELKQFMAALATVGQSKWRQKVEERDRLLARMEG